jgi:hypothetical protein
MKLELDFDTVTFIAAYLANADTYFADPRNRRRAREAARDFEAAIGIANEREIAAGYVRELMK